MTNLISVSHIVKHFEYISIFDAWEKILNIYVYYNLLPTMG